MQKITVKILTINCFGILFSGCNGGVFSSQKSPDSQVNMGSPTSCRLGPSGQGPAPFGLKNDSPPPRLVKACRVTAPVSVSPIKVLSKSEITARLSAEEIRNLGYYSENMHYGSITVGALKMDSLATRILPWAKDDPYVKIATSIQGALGKLESSPGRVFRGINDVKPTDLKNFVAAMENGTAITLGRDCVKWCSASRNPAVAKKYANSCGSTLSYSAVLVIDQKSARSVEKISPNAYLAEFLLPASAKYRVKSIWPLGDNNQSVVIYLEEE